MSATTFKNVVRRREHYERHQPAARERFGLLEKHKDYVQRAKNYHAKEKRIAELRKKAANRNPDEFYFKMLSTRTKDGVHEGKTAGEEAPKLTGDMLKLMKTQDKAYVQTVKSHEDKQIEKLQSALHILPQGGAGGNKHTVFVDSEADAARFDAADYFATDPALVERTFNRPRKDALESATLVGVPEAGAGGAVDKVARKAAKKAARLREKAYAELEARLDRSTRLRRLGAHMDLQRALMGKGRRVKVADGQGEAPAVFKWRPERKR